MDHEFKLLEVIDFINNQKEPIALLINVSGDQKLDSAIFGSLMKLVKSQKLELYFNSDNNNNDSAYPVPFCFYDTEYNRLLGFSI